MNFFTLNIIIFIELKHIASVLSSPEIYPARSFCDKSFSFLVTPMLQVYIWAHKVNQYSHFHVSVTLKEIYYQKIKRKSIRFKPSRKCASGYVWNYHTYILEKEISINLKKGLIGVCFQLKSMVINEIGIVWLVIYGVKFCENQVLTEATELWTLDSGSSVRLIEWSVTRL